MSDIDQISDAALSNYVQQVEQGRYYDDPETVRTSIDSAWSFILGPDIGTYLIENYFDARIMRSYVWMMHAFLDVIRRRYCANQYSAYAILELPLCGHAQCRIYGDTDDDYPQWYLRHVMNNCWRPATHDLIQTMQMPNLNLQDSIGLQQFACVDGSSVFHCGEVWFLETYHHR